MRFKSLITLILTVSLAVITSNAMAKGKKSGKSDKSDKSAKYSQKSEKSGKSAKSGKSGKSGKSDKSGKGYGHCKSDKSGKGHSKKRGKGHDRDCDDDNPDPVELVCTATASDVERSVVLEERFDTRGGSLGLFIASISYVGPICAIGDETAYEGVETEDAGLTTCSGGATGVPERMESETEYWYDMEVVLGCNPSS